MDKIPKFNSDYDFQIPEGKVIVVGDTRPRHFLELTLEAAEGMPEKVFAAIGGEKPAAVFHLGDMVTAGSFTRSWQKTFEKHARPVFEAGIWIYPVLGNHEMDPFKKRGLDNYFAHFPLLEKKRWYSVRAGSIVYLVLDSNFYALSNAEQENQRAWLDQILDSVDQDPAVASAVALCHHPPYTNVAPRYLVWGDKRIQREWLPRFERSAKLKILFSGHIHTYEHFLSGKVHCVVTGGGGSPRFYLLSYGEGHPRDVYRAQSRLRDFHYMRLTPDGKKMRVEMAAWDKTWTTKDSFVLE